MLCDIARATWKSWWIWCGTNILLSMNCCMLLYCMVKTTAVCWLYVTGKGWLQEHNRLLREWGYHAVGRTTGHTVSPESGRGDQYSKETQRISRGRCGEGVEWSRGIQNSHNPGLLVIVQMHVKCRHCIPITVVGSWIRL